MNKVAAADDGCWLWTGARSKGGYGRFSVGSRADGTYRLGLAHRVAYELFVGAIPDGLHIDHLCRVTACVNPQHLEAVTSTENRRRAARAVLSCPKGHKYTAANTRVAKDGTRNCRQCSREMARVKRGHSPDYEGLTTAQRNALKTACPKGHPYTHANTRLDGRSRHCKACHRERERARREARRVAA
ncbi:MAG: HNH endonuclease signature motif containing protein [Dehalococcoidia bacterium]